MDNCIGEFINVDDTVFSVIERETAQKVNRTTSLDSLNLDSLEFMNLLLEIGSATGKEVPDSKLGDLHTVGDIVEALC